MDPKYICDKVKHNKINCVKRFLSEGGDVNTRNSSDQTLLWIAVNLKHVELCDVLVNAAGVNVNAEDRHGRTILHFAAWYGFFELCKAMIVRKVKVNKTNKEKETALHFAAENEHLDVCRALIEAGAIVDSLDEDGATPLHRGAICKHIGICRLLLENKANVFLTHFSLFTFHQN